MLLRRLIRKMKGVGHRWGFGVQSPFAYQFTKMLFSKPHGAFWHDQTEEIIRKIQNWQQTQGKNTVIIDIDDRGETERQLDSIDDDTLLILKGIYRNKKAYRYWKELLIREKIRVTFDLYYVGVIAIRHGLSKHNYILNY